MVPHHIPVAIVLFGLIIHLAALAPLRKLIGMVPAGPLRTKWLVMAALVAAFIVSYALYAAMVWQQPNGWSGLVVPAIFLAGAVFVWLAVSLSQQTAVTLQRISQLEIETITDPLTKVYNRRYLEQRLDEEVARAKRYAMDLSIFLIDIDSFKTINDNHGHPAGDACLCALGNVMKTTLRDLDLVTRSGGDEFMVICTNTAPTEAAMVAERLLDAVRKHPVEVKDDLGETRTLHMTLSVGVAGLGPTVDSKRKLVQAADRALYGAKDSGKDRVKICGAATPAHSPHFLPDCQK